MARTAFAAVAFGMLSAANALEVVSPDGGISVLADRAYTVEWTGTTTGRFEIDLYYCNSFCMDDVCGDWVTALCPYGADGCPDSAGDYDIIMPEPMSGTSSGYKVMVKNAEDESDMGCSDDFTLIASEDAPEAGEMGYSLTVTSPSDGDTAMAGEVYTVEWDYENGFGSSTDRFALDLYLVGGTGDCGTYVTTLCDQPSIGCPDSQGDYDVEIPSDTPAGMYSIRVGVFDDEMMYDCSDTFEVDTSDDMTISMRF
ncbi:unnamed protein product [Ectocarpus sp. CCAP 1310/34]|nr:unnamed protein product [Ectocarpus sp. CCAP 1310/34]